MGFRSQSGTLQAAQLLSDVIAMQRRLGCPLWLASFDIEKCFDTLPWWALFRLLQKVGIPSAVVRAFHSFYQHLRRRFRYGQVDGGAWHAANGLAQGCPASPDLLNFLFEPFHRWAWASGLGGSDGLDGHPFHQLRRRPCFVGLIAQRYVHPHLQLPRVVSAARHQRYQGAALV
jgi:hypothetical protein